MATETGTATDYKDLLQKLKLFLTGANSPTSGLTWTVLRENSDAESPQDGFASADGISNVGDQRHDEILFRGNGGVSPENNIYFGIHTYGLSTTGYYNWQIRGFTGFTDTSPETDFINQPGFSPPAYLPLQNSSMTYWFMGNERRVMGAVKTGTAYQTFYLGFINPFATTAEYPYPLYIQATSFEETRIFSSNSVGLAGMPNPAGSSVVTAPVPGDPYPTISSSGWIRFVDGAWYKVQNFSVSGSSESPKGNGTGLCNMWPMFPVQTASLFPVENRPSFNISYFVEYANTAPGGATTDQLLPAMGSPGLTTLWPLTLFLPNSNNILGEIDGAFWIHAAGGITAEDTITDFGISPEEEYIVFQNVHRSDAWSFFAMRND